MTVEQAVVESTFHEMGYASSTDYAIKKAQEELLRELKIIHRWDNAHPVDLPTSPHHHHIGSEENVLPSEPITSERVLTHIATIFT